MEWIDRTVQLYSTCMSQCDLSAFMACCPVAHGLCASRWGETLLSRMCCCVSLGDLGVVQGGRGRALSAHYSFMHAHSTCRRTTSALGSVVGSPSPSPRPGIEGSGGFSSTHRRNPIGFRGGDGSPTVGRRRARDRTWACRCTAVARTVGSHATAQRAGLRC